MWLPLKMLVHYATHVNFKEVFITHKLLVLNSILIHRNTQKNVLILKMKLKRYFVIQKSENLKNYNDEKYFHKQILFE